MSAFDPLQTLGMCIFCYVRDNTYGKAWLEECASLVSIHRLSWAMQLTTRMRGSNLAR